MKQYGEAFRKPVDPFSGEPMADMPLMVGLKSPDGRMNIVMLPNIPEDKTATDRELIQRTR